MKIKGSHFVITGGASGLGLASAKLLVAKGGSVSLFDMNTDKGEAAERALGSRARFFQVDVTDAKSVSTAISKGVEAFGDIRGLLNCAGVGIPGKVLSRSGKPANMRAFEWVIKVNLIGSFNVLRLVAKQMASSQPNAEGERGVIINTASVAAYEGQIGQASYSASKGGVVAMTLPIARELGRHGIRCNTIAPGLFMTPMLAALPPKARESLAKQTEFPKRLGRPKEFAFMCQHVIENEYINGTVIRVDASIRMSKM